jgi:hypothetical protein
MAITSYLYFILYQCNEEGFKDTKGVTRSRKSKRIDNKTAKRKRTKGQTTTCKTLHRKLKIEQHGPTKNRVH